MALTIQTPADATSFAPLRLCARLRENKQDRNGSGTPSQRPRVVDRSKLLTAKWLRFR
jgi:hypothetical protein